MLITGASRGIGESLARAFASAGADVAQVATFIQRVEDEAGPITEAPRRTVELLLTGVPHRPKGR